MILQYTCLHQCIMCLHYGTVFTVNRYFYIPGGTAVGGNRPPDTSNHLNMFYHYCFKRYCRGSVNSVGLARMPSGAMWILMCPVYTAVDQQCMVFQYFVVYICSLLSFFSLCCVDSSFCAADCSTSLFMYLYLYWLSVGCLVSSVLVTCSPAVVSDDFMLC